MSAGLLPPNSGLFEKAAAEVIEFPPEIGEAVDDLHGVKYARPLNQTVAPHLVLEYGLGRISQFFGTYESLIDEGRVWQKFRGTPLAITTSMSWIEYDNVFIEDQNVSRRRWHLYQLGMGEIPAANEEVQRLTNAEYLADISDRARSELFRGYHGYDVRGLSWSRKRWGRSLFGDSSGVRIPGGNVKWSHGRTHELSGDAVITDWADLDIDYVSGMPVSWSDSIPWSAPGVTWSGVSDAGLLKAWSMLRKRAYVAFLRSDGSVIGYSLVVVPPIDVTPNDVDYGDEFFIRYEVQTDFGDGDGEESAFVAVAYNGEPAEGVKPFKKWFSPSDVVFPAGAVIVGHTAFAHKFMKTVRERVVFTLGF